ncbi:sugar phosphate isomerase/epimerase family protein [Lederbergia graminis]|uniref:Sugar phosphate isomerase/epimerase family protein n=1 Tax=Lederbergia graminis TaxID=735518 RepID=A0ABW0LKC5_9BACI
MKIGISSYSLNQALQSGEMDILDVIQWASDNGADHLEIVPIGFSMDDKLIDYIRDKADKVGIEISHYLVGANFIQNSEVGVEAEVKRVKEQVDIAHKLGVKMMRHDVASRPLEETSIIQFEHDLPTLVKACREIADYATQFGIITSVENHGYYVQASDRIQRLVHEVNRANFKTTVDIGNFLCVDENPVSAVQKNIPYASMIHFKDFYLRPASENPGDGFFRTTAGNYLRGSIFGQGDIDVREIIRIIKNSNYDGYISLEFEGMEECKLGTKVGLENMKRLLAELV